MYLPSKFKTPNRFESKVDSVMRLKLINFKIEIICFNCFNLVSLIADVQFKFEEGFHVLYKKIFEGLKIDHVTTLEWKVMNVSDSPEPKHSLRVFSWIPELKENDKDYVYHIATSVLNAFATINESTNIILQNVTECKVCIQENSLPVAVTTYEELDNKSFTYLEDMFKRKALIERANVDF